MAIRLVFRCGCAGSIAEGRCGGEPPTCVVHGAPIARVQARPPAIVGVAHGPHVTTRALDPVSPTLTMAGHGPLVLTATEQTHG